MEKILYIETIEIEKLWGKYHIKWNLEPDVNILAGINGSGKSTVLNIAAGVLTGGNFVGKIDNLIDEVKISFNDNKMLCFSSNRKPFQSKFNFYGLKDIHKEVISDVIKIRKISTFEQPIITKYVTQQHYLPEEIKTDLDIQIFELQRAYLSYQINLGKRVEDIFLEGAPIDIKTKR